MPFTQVKKEFDIDEKTDSEILKDEQIELIKKDGNPFRLRRIAYWHEPHNKVYEFITNNYELPPDKIADIIVVKENPLINLESLLDIQMVIHNGRIIRDER